MSDAFIICGISLGMRGAPNREAAIGYMASRLADFTDPVRRSDLQAECTRILDIIKPVSLPD